MALPPINMNAVFCVGHEKRCHTLSSYVQSVNMYLFRREEHWESLAWHIAVLFLGGLLLPSGGPH